MASSGTLTGQASLVTAACQGKLIPQNLCDFTACMGVVGQFGGPSSTTTTAAATFASGNTGLRNKPCCPDIVGAFSQGTFSATQAAVPGTAVNASRVVVVPTNGNQVRFTFIDTNGQSCQATYSVTWGTVANVEAGSNPEAQYGPSYVNIWIAPLLVAVVLLLLCVVYRRSVMHTLRISEPKLERHEDGMGAPADGRSASGSAPPASAPGGGNHQGGSVTLV